MTGKEFTLFLKEEAKKEYDEEIELRDMIFEELTIKDMKWIRHGSMRYGGSSDYREWICQYKDQYFRLTGWYASYEGYDINEDYFQEVEPYEITITEFKNK